MNTRKVLVSNTETSPMMAVKETRVWRWLNREVPGWVVGGIAMLLLADGVWFLNFARTTEESGPVDGLAYLGAGFTIIFAAQLLIYHFTGVKQRGKFWVSLLGQAATVITTGFFLTQGWQWLPVLGVGVLFVTQATLVALTYRGRTAGTLSPLERS